MNDEEIYNWAMGEWDRLYGHIDFYDPVNKGLDVPCITDLAVKKAREEGKKEGWRDFTGRGVAVCEDCEKICVHAKPETLCNCEEIIEKLKSNNFSLPKKS